MSAWITEPALKPDGRGNGFFDVYENTEEGRFVAVVDRKPDADLIAAAPDLLAALEWALGQLDDDLDLGHQDAMRAAHAALARAKGAV
jgi:hypothetical protein